MQRKWKGGSNIRAPFAETFSTKVWTKMTLASRSEHSMERCRSCALKTKWQNKSPCPSTRYASLPVAAHGVARDDTSGSHRQKAEVAHRQQAEVALQVLKKRKRKNGKSFERAVVKTKNTKLQLKPNDYGKEKLKIKPSSKFTRSPATDCFSNDVSV